MKSIKKESIKKKIAKEIFWLFIILFIIRGYVIQAYRVPTGSMEDTILIGDHLFALKCYYELKMPFTNKNLIKFTTPKRGDIVVFRYPFERKDYVKRCIAVGGDIVEIKNKVVYVNRLALYEPYVVHKSNEVYHGVNLDKDEYQKLWVSGKFIRAGYAVRDNFGPVKVPNGTIFLLGDNRDFSYDSRYWGPLPLKYVLGKAFIFYFSWSPEVPFYKIYKKIRWNKIGNIILN